MWPQYPGGAPAAGYGAYGFMAVPQVPAAPSTQPRPTARTYEVRHTRRARKNDETASTIDRYGREDTSGIERARVQNYRWKPSVVIGHG